MELLGHLTAETILTDEILIEIFEQEDEISKARLLLDLTDRAKQLGVKTKFEKLVAAYKKVHSELSKSQPTKAKPQSFDNYTQFDSNYDEYYCGNWIADATGIRTFTIFGERLACYHPILLVQRLINAETGKEKVKLAFKKGFSWREIIIDKEVIASNNKIVSLAGYGVSVTSETSRALVQFLSDIENYNINKIGIQMSTSKLGWINGEFMPYGGGVVFDSDIKFKDIFESVCEQGDFDIWMDLIENIRSKKRVEPQIYMAASLASILVKPLSVLPFIVNLWGETGKGKTVCMMLAASMWANPAENKYITDSTSSRVALEVRDDILNNLPMMIDDLSKMRDKFGEEFADIIYMLCGGKGKDRSNVNLGLNKPTTWSNTVLTNIERPLATDTMRGGAINRILDFEMESGSIFENGNAVVEILSRNYGFAGKLFVKQVEVMGFEKIREIQQAYLKRINERAKELGVEKEEKQSIPLSIMLTADKIATDFIFEDGIYMDLDYCVNALKNRGEVSENVRAYDFIMSEISVNINKFKPDEEGIYKGEVWGCIDKEYVTIINNAFNRICERGNFSNRAFLNWASKHGYIEVQGGKNTKVVRISGALSRCVRLKLLDEQEKEGFVEIDTTQIELPF